MKTVTINIQEIQYLTKEVTFTVSDAEANKLKRWYNKMDDTNFHERDLIDVAENNCKFGSDYDHEITEQMITGFNVE